MTPEQERALVTERQLAASYRRYATKKKTLRLLPHEQRQLDQAYHALKRAGYIKDE